MLLDGAGERPAQGISLHQVAELADAAGKRPLERDRAGSSPALMPGECPWRGCSKACDDILGRGGHELNARKRELNNGYLPWRIIVA